MLMNLSYDPFLFLDCNLLYIIVSKLLFKAFTEILKTNFKNLLVKICTELSSSIQHLYEKVYENQKILADVDYNREININFVQRTFYSFTR